MSCFCLFRVEEGGGSRLSLAEFIPRNENEIDVKPSFRLDSFHAGVCTGHGMRDDVMIQQCKMLIGSECTGKLYLSGRVGGWLIYLLIVVKVACAPLISFSHPTL